MGRRRLGIRATVVVAAGTAVVVAVVAAVVLGAFSSSRPVEGGRGRAVMAVSAQMPIAPSTIAPSTPSPARTRAQGQAALASPAQVPPATLIATLKASTTYSGRPGGPVIGTLPAVNPFGSAEVLAVVGSPDAAGWVQVELPIRPNGSRGWIRTAGVVFSQTSYQVVVNVQADAVTVTDAGHLVLTTPAAVGKPSTPTPVGHTYLWELIRPDNPDGAYGPYIFGLALFSDTYAVFNGGDAQIGIHGQDEPSSVGHPESHGCVRLGNDVISRLAGMLPLGTPVTIV
jgi:lipoprotein-anchoring transpeptidase ErfK/SrfK